MMLRGSDSCGLASGFQVCLNRWLQLPQLLKGSCFYRTRSHKTLQHVLISQGRSGPGDQCFRKTHFPGSGPQWWRYQ